MRTAPAVAPATDPILTVRDLTTGYFGVPVVRNADMDIPRGAITSVIGPNGAGKSTALKAVVGLLKAWTGEVRMNGADITAMPAHARVGKGLAFVPQGRIVLPEMSVLQNLEIGAFTIRKDRARVKEALDRVMTLFPILRERRAQAAGTMSGGEQQMLAIARALMTSPQLIVLDEPSLGLSPKLVDVVFAKMTELKREGFTVAMVEQKASKALEISDWAYVLHTGRVAFSGAAQSILHDEQVKRLYLGQGPEETADGDSDDDET
ncbi:MAG: ABC transporter ATP-binding protein [Alphaproteobacteria bacterium]|nr:ABC transporter ATP-binding protein [Alphaproteobacteria bacterium]